MKHKILKFSTVILLFAFINAGCQKENEPILYQATGEILFVTSGCYGEAVVIEVDNPKGIGTAGTFSLVGDTNRIVYENAIAVPYFSKIPEIPDSIIPQKGLYLNFEYRELKEEEMIPGLFTANLSHPCLAIYGSPNAKHYMITKINNY